MTTLELINEMRKRYERMHLLVERMEAVRCCKYKPEYEEYLLDIIYTAMHNEQAEVMEILEKCEDEQMGIRRDE